MTRIALLLAIALLSGPIGSAAAQDAETLRDQLSSGDAAQRIRALRVAGPGLQRDAGLMHVIVDLAADPEASVRLEALRQAEFVWPGLRTGMLLDALRRDGANPDVRDAVLHGGKAIALELLDQIAGDADLLGANDLAGLIGELAQASVQSSGAHYSSIQSVLGAVPAENDALLKQLASGFVWGAVDANRWDLVKRLLHDGAIPAPLDAEMLEEASSTAANGADLEARLHAIGVLSAAAYDSAGPQLLGLIAQSQPIQIQSAALRALASLGDAAMVRPLLLKWPSMGPEIRQQLMFSELRPERYIIALLDAIEAGVIELKILRPWGLDSLLNHHEIKIRNRARALLPPEDPAIAADVLATYQTVTQLDGDVNRGRTLYEENCALCHRFDGGGNEVGPDLDVKALAGTEVLLRKLLYPNRDALTFFYSYTIETADFEQFTGIIVAEEEDAIVLRIPGGQDNRIAREDIDSMVCTEMTLMPEGWRTSFGEQGLADITRFLSETAQALEKARRLAEIQP